MAENLPLPPPSCHCVAANIAPASWQKLVCLSSSPGCANVPLDSQSARGVRDGFRILRSTDFSGPTVTSPHLGVTSLACHWGWHGTLSCLVLLSCCPCHSLCCPGAATSGPSLYPSSSVLVVPRSPLCPTLLSVSGAALPSLEPFLFWYRSFLLRCISYTVKYTDLRGQLDALGDRHTPM